MFYCTPCQRRKAWPESMSKSRGRCEVCEEVAVCNDVPSAYLPPPPQPRSEIKKPVGGWKK